jgi:cysteine sulfinate desulfinase/cysteine desulfurase-like protein
MIYLDNAATTQVDKEVKEAMLPYLNDFFANPSSKFYKSATKADSAIKNARKNVADLLDCDIYSKQLEIIKDWKDELMAEHARKVNGKE